MNGDTRGSITPRLTEADARAPVSASRHPVSLMPRSSAPASCQPSGLAVTGAPLVSTADFVPAAEKCTPSAPGLPIQ